MFITLSQSIDGKLNVTNSNRSIELTKEQCLWLFTEEDIEEQDIDYDKFKKAYSITK